MTRSLPKLALATWAPAPELLGDETRILQLLREAGVCAQAEVWDDPKVQWEQYDYVIIRSTWDYFEKYSLFLTWLEKIENLGCRVLNSPALIRWNSNKVYLKELDEKGCSIVPSIFIDKGATVSLKESLKNTNWQTLIIKPTVSGAAWRTWKFERDEIEKFEGKFSEILQDSEALIQPYLKEIETEGEISLLYFDGKFSHAVRKLPAANDFRVQGQFGGTSVAIQPEKQTLTAAEKSLAALPEPPLYARVDGVVLNGEFKLMEMELIEPWLYFSEGAPEAERFVQSLLRKINA